MTTAHVVSVLERSGIQVNHTERGYFWGIRGVRKADNGPYPTDDEALAAALRWLIATATVFIAVDEAAIASGPDVFTTWLRLLQRSGAIV